MVLPAGGLRLAKRERVIRPCTCAQPFACRTLRKPLTIRAMSITAIGRKISATGPKVEFANGRRSFQLSGNSPITKSSAIEAMTATIAQTGGSPRAVAAAYYRRIGELEAIAAGRARLNGR